MQYYTVKGVKSRRFAGNGRHRSPGAPGGALREGELSAPFSHGILARGTSEAVRGRGALSIVVAAQQPVGEDEPDQQVEDGVSQDGRIDAAGDQHGRGEEPAQEGDAEGAERALVGV